MSITILSRWDRLDYTKSQTGDDFYNFNAWRYFSEYNTHMYAWFLTGWAYEKNVPGFSFVALKARIADVDPHDIERGDDAWRNVLYFSFGILGI